MRILVVNGIDWVGGAERWIAHLARGLVGRGHVVAVAHHPDSDLGRLAAEAGATTIALGSRRRPSPIGVARLVRSGGYAAVVATVRRELRAVGLAARLAGHRGAVARLHSGWAPDDRLRESRWRRARHRAYHRLLVDRAATNSAAGREDLVARGYLPAERIEVIYNGVDLDRFDPDRVPHGRLRAELGIDREDLLAVSVSRYLAAKGQAIELEAAARFVASRPDAHLVFAGPCREAERDYREALEARAAGFPGASRIRFLGAREDVDEVLADADLLLRCSFEEGLPNIVLEAMAMRVPVVATAICGTPEAVVDGETGRLVPVGDADRAARAIREILTAPAERRAAMGAAGRRIVERRFRLDRMVDRWEALLAAGEPSRTAVPA